MKRESEEREAQMRRGEEQRQRDETKESTSAELRQIHQSMDENFRKLFEADLLPKRD
jgi:hypothetical protein